jgi:hypothetical protein
VLTKAVPQSGDIPMTGKSYTSPFFAEEISNTNSEYWLARRKLAGAVRELIETATISDVPPGEAEAISEELQSISARLRKNRQLRGIIAYAKAHGSFPVANHEILCVGGASHPIAPGLRAWDDGDVVRGSVQFDWAYEGPPDHVHGGWVAAVLDHFMGMAQMRSGAPGMTGGLDVRYVKPTPIGKKLDLIATFERISTRKNRVSAEISCEGETTATAEAVFVQPKSAIFTDGLDGVDTLNASG